MSGSTTLAFASLMHARMNGIHLLFANLSYANMFGVECVESQCRLHDALSLVYAILSNGANTTVSYRSAVFLRNGYANCTGGSKNDHLAGWKVPGDHVFTPEKGALSQPTDMSQRVYLSLFERLIVNCHP